MPEKAYLTAQSVTGLFIRTRQLRCLVEEIPHWTMRVILRISVKKFIWCTEENGFAGRKVLSNF